MKENSNEVAYFFADLYELLKFVEFSLVFTNSCHASIILPTAYLST